MNTTTKSPRKVAYQALAVATSVLPLYAHANSPKLYTQPQLFACLVLKLFFKTDYRGIVALLHDLPDLREELGMSLVPHPTTLQKAVVRLLKHPPARQIFQASVPHSCGRRRRSQRVAFDSTGLDCGHASRYFIRRRFRKESPW